MTKQIPLTQGQVAIVCDCHAHLVDGYAWRAEYNSKMRSYYAARETGRRFGKRTKILMHHEVNNTPEGTQTDHINGDPLDNRCENLRSATWSQNMMNAKTRADNGSGFKGVYYNKERHKWVAQITVNGNQKYLGLYDSEDQAHQVRAQAERDLHGEFARGQQPTTELGNRIARTPTRNQNSTERKTK